MTEEEQLAIQYFEYINENACVNPNDVIKYPPVALSCGSFDLVTSKGKETFETMEMNTSSKKKNGLQRRRAT